MTLDVPDPLNCEGDDLYAIYRKGLITRHITINGRFLESIAIERIDDSDQASAEAGPFIEVEHSAPFGHSGPNLTIRIPKANARYSEEIAPNAPCVDGCYTVKPHLWAPLITPIKYPGMPERETGQLRRGASPWLPQAPYRKSYSMQKAYYVACSERSDNPGYYGGMALAALALEALHGVSPYSIEYARKLIEGFLAMEMNGKNGYIIRYDRWHTKRGEVKEIRGASSEELLGIMLGIMYYLKAEDPGHSLYAAAMDLRDRILGRVSQGSIKDKYEHPFMIQSYWVKHFEVPLYASRGENRGSQSLYVDCLFAGVSSYIVGMGNAQIEKDPLQNLSMDLYSILLVLEGGLSRQEKEEWAVVFLSFVKKVHTCLGDRVHKNAFLGIVSLLIKKYLNHQQFLAIWTRTSYGPGGEVLLGLDLSVWDEMVGAAERRIALCGSLHNERFDVDAEFLREADDHWQHNLPLYMVVHMCTEKCPEPCPDKEQPIDWKIQTGDASTIGWVWKPHNPHRRIGGLFPWKEEYPHWWRGGLWKFLDFAVGWHDAVSLNEQEYDQSEDKRYDSQGHLEKEVLGFRRHEDTQIEAAGMDLLFLRMLLTQINPHVYPAPQLSDREVYYPVLPFRGVEPLEPKFLHYACHYRSVDDGWEIRGDTDKALGVIFFPGKGVIVTATAGDDEKLQLNTWRLTHNRFVHLHTRYDEGRFDQVVLRKTSSTANASDKDILVVAKRAEKEQTGTDLHSLWIVMYKVSSGGGVYPLASKRVSEEGGDAVKVLDMCILNYQYVGVTYKTRHDKARVKILVLDFANNQILERNALDAEYGSGVEHQEIEDAVWIGSAWSDVLINGYKSKADPYHHFDLFSRRITSLGNTCWASAPASKEKPIGAVTVQRGGKYYLVSASYDHVPRSGFEWTLFSLNSWEILPNGELVYQGAFTERDTDMDRQYLFKHALDLERLSMSRAWFGREGGFVLAGKGFSDARRERECSNQGLIVLYGGVLDDGRPTLWDWTCIGSGSSDSVKMVDVCGDARLGDQRGAVTACKDKGNGLFLTWWRFGRDFELGDEYQVNPPGLAANRESPVVTAAGEDGND